jgi:DNA topoisomerase-6 subunit B
MRFANKVPLLYQQGACAITDSVEDINWKSYGLQQSSGNLPVGPLIILVHIASIWVPFTSEAKEAVAHYSEIIKEIKLALQECGRNLGRYLSRRLKKEEAEKKKSYIEKYLPHIAVGLGEILNLNETQEKRVVKELKDILERSRE